MPSTRRHITLALALLALATCPLAQAQDPQKIRFRAICFDPRDTAAPKFHIPDGGGRSEVTIPKTSLSETISATLRAGGFIDFFESADADRPAVSVKLPVTGHQRLLVLLAPSGTGFDGRAMQLPATGFGGGDTLVLNMSRIPISIRYGDGAPGSVPAGSHTTFSLPANFPEPMIPVQVFEQDQVGEWQIAQSTRWAVDDRFRSFLFVYQSPRNQRLTLHGITERRGPGGWGGEPTEEE
jgi:hypothetical protein